MLALDNISMNFGGQVIFNGISLMVGAGERVGLVGRNGAGKTTLLRIISGKQNPSSGSVVLQKDTRTGYLPQQMKHSGNKSLVAELTEACGDVRQVEKEIDRLQKELEKEHDYHGDEYHNLVQRYADLNERHSMLGGQTLEAEIERTLLGLGFSREEFDRPVTQFSGGWRMRVELAKVLIAGPDVLLLDEPTNHLDIESIQWLEDFLKAFRGSLILISHDRALLDSVTTRTVEITLGKMYDYKAPYSRFMEMRKERREQQLAAYRNQQKKIADTEKFIERFRYKATKAVQVQSRIKQLEKMDRVEIELEDHTAFDIRFPDAPRSGTIVVETRSLSKSFGEHQVLKNIDLIIERGEKVAFVGKNGEGKTTLSRILAGELDFTGHLKKGHNTSIGYFAQNQDEIMDERLTVLETIDREAVGEIRTQIRDILGAFLFHGDDVDKKVKVLSGGERSRLALARLLLSPCNLLILDEPTNHLDMRSKDILKNALQKYNGTMIVVSHDREFLDGLAGKIYEFTGGGLKEHSGDIYGFLRKKNISSLRELEKRDKKVAKGHREEDRQAGGNTAGASGRKMSREKAKELERRTRKAEKQIESCESKIESLEKTLGQMDEKMSGAETITGQELFSEYEQTRHELTQEMIRWEKLHNDLEKLKQRKSS